MWSAKIKLGDSLWGKWICPANHRAPQRHTDRQETDEAELRKHVISELIGKLSRAS